MRLPTSNAAQGCESAARQRGQWRDRALGPHEALTKPIVDGAATGGSQGAIGLLLDVALSSWSAMK